jgi:capsular polysaccharide biosynthesis protein
LEERISYAKLLYNASKRWWLCLLFVALGTSAAFVLSKDFHKTQYIAVNEYVIEGGLNQDLRILLKSYETLTKTDYLSQQVAAETRKEESHLTPEVIQENTKFRLMDKSSLLFSISYTSTNKTEAEEISKLVNKVLLAEQKEVFRTNSIRLLIASGKQLIEVAPKRSMDYLTGAFLGFVAFVVVLFFLPFKVKTMHRRERVKE